ncbi:MAG: hypothetical protein Kow0096_06040 [Thiohalomonadaceae bacterium]
MSLPRLLFLLLLLLPVLEIYLLLQVGGVIGAIPTIALVVFTAVLGALLLRHQGLAVLQRVQQLMQQSEAPTAAMLEGVVILLSGAMLLLPGFFTDALGLLGLVPPLRHALVAAILRRGLPRRPPPSGPAARPRRGPATLEGQYTREDD